MAGTFDEMTNVLLAERLQRAMALLDDLVSAEGSDEAMPSWEGLLTEWTYLSPQQREAIKAEARRVMPHDEVGRRRLEVVEDWPS